MKRGKKVLCSILSLALLCALSLPARAAEPWRTLEGIAYYGDRSKCAMTEEQARTFVDVIEREMEAGLRHSAFESAYSLLGFSALFDAGNGNPALFFVKTQTPNGGGGLYYNSDGSVTCEGNGEAGIWTFQNEKLIHLEGADFSLYPSCVVRSSFNPGGPGSTDMIYSLSNGQLSDVPDHIYQSIYDDDFEVSFEIDGISATKEQANAFRAEWFNGNCLAYAEPGGGVAYNIKGLTPIDQAKSALLSYASAAQTSTRVTLHLNGGTGGSALWTNDSGTIQVPTNPTREGYTFGGWFTDPDFTTAWNFNSAVTGELSLYAKWVPVSSTASTVGQNTQAISFNGKQVEVQAYTLHADNGGDVTYVKLRDMAALLGGSAAQFNVDWKNGAIYVERGKPYTTRNGTELQPIAGTDGSYEWNTAPILFDGTTTAIEGIVLEGSEGSHTFLKLRDLANAIGFTVDWRAGEGIIIGTE